MELARNIVQAFPKIFKRVDEQERKISQEQQNQDTDYDFCEDENNDKMLMDEENPYVLLDFLSPPNVKKSDEGSSTALLENQSSESHMTGSIMENLFSEMPAHKTLQTTIPGAILPENKENVVNVNNSEQNNAIVESSTTLHQAYSLPDPPPIEASLEDPTIRSRARVEERASNVSISNVALNNPILDALEMINTIPTVGPSFLNQEGILNDRVISSADTPLAASDLRALPGFPVDRAASLQIGVSNIAVQQNAGNIPQPNGTELNSNVVGRSLPSNSSSAVSAPLAPSQATPSNQTHVGPSVVNQEGILNARVISSTEPPLAARGSVSVPRSSEVRTASSQAGVSNVAVPQSPGNIPQPNNAALNSNVVTRPSPFNSSSAASAPLIFSQVIPNQPQVRPVVVNQERSLNNRLVSGAEMHIAALGPVSAPGSSEDRSASSQAGVSNVVVQQNAGNILQPNNTALNSSFAARPSSINSSSAISAPLAPSQATPSNQPQVRPSAVNQERNVNDRVISSTEPPLAARGSVSVSRFPEVRTASSQAGVSNVAVPQSAGNIPQPNNTALNSSFAARPSPPNSSSAVSAPLAPSQATPSNQPQVRPSVVNQERIVNDRVISGAETPIAARGPVSVPGSTEVRTASSQAGVSNVAVPQSAGNIPTVSIAPVVAKPTNDLSRAEVKRIRMRGV